MTCLMMVVTWLIESIDLVLKCVQLIGIPVAIGVFAYNKHRERLEHEYATYDALDDKYMNYLQLCLQHPDLDVADVAKSPDDANAANSNTSDLKSDHEHRELIMLSLLIVLSEHT